MAALVGVAAGHFVAALTDPAASPVLVVGTQVIDLTPTPVKEFAIARFGTADKPILIGTVFGGVLAFAFGLGVVSRSRPRWASVGLLILGMVAAGLTVLRPGNGAHDVIPAAVTTMTAVGLLLCLRHEALRGSDATDAAGRRVLLLSGAALGLAAVLGGAGRKIASARTRPGDFALPAPAEPIPPLPRGLNNVTPFRTSTSAFYRVDTRLSLPVVDVDTWSLTVDGDVDHTVRLGFDDLLAMDLIERDITLTCVSNDVGGPYVGGARWLGVRLTDVLDRAGFARTRADQILSTDVDGMTISTPLRVATDGRDSMIAVGMNGGPLSREHGFPARLIVPGLYGFVGATKWISGMTLTTYRAHDAYWTKRGWATDAPVKIASRIDTPRPLATVPAGDTIIGGIAWAQHQGGIDRVEVSVDDGPWRSATLGPSGGQDYWRQWFTRWTATPGRHTLASRAVNARGDVQTPLRASPFPNGSSGIQRIIVTIE